MRNLHKLVWIIAIGALVIGCMSSPSSGNSSSSNPDIDSAIVAKWYTTQTNADDGGTKGLIYEFKADGTYSDADTPVTDATFTAKEGKLIATKTESGDVKTSADYTIEGNKLIISNTAGSVGRFKAYTLFKAAGLNAPKVPRF